jgi:GT2 family glycosyltransferase
LTAVKMDLSFILLSWNSEKYIKSCLNSIMSAIDLTPLSYEIFIIDNGSEDQTRGILSSLKNEYPNTIKPIFLERNMGTTFPRNIGIRKSKGQYLCIMDSDVDLLKGTIEKLMKNLNSMPAAGMAVPEIVYPNGNLQKSTDTFPTITRKIFRYFFLKKLERKEADQKRTVFVREVECAISAFWLIRKDVVDDVGLLDENFFYAPEDIDYCLRVWKKGYKIVYDNSVSVVHHTQEISRGLKLNKAFFEHIKGLLYYFKKHGYVFKKPVF